MSQSRPELIFVAGPQTGERTVLSENTMVAGRAPSCDLTLVEEFSSRRQMRFEAAPDGWIMENLSDRGTKVNGKKYPAGKRIMLDSGDVIGVGMATEILFVAPGDDADAVLAEYRERKPAPAPSLKVSAPEPAKPAPAEPPAKPAEPAQAPAGIAEPPAAQAKPKGMDDATRKRLKKYGIGFAVYVGLLALGVVLIKSRGNGGDEHPGSISDQPWKSDEIADALRTADEKPRNMNAAATELEKALRAYDERNFSDGALYRCVKHFKFHLAYKNSPAFDKLDHQRKFDDAFKQLRDKVQTDYNEAWKAEQARNWSVAERYYGHLLLLLPPEECKVEDPHTYKLVNHIIAHCARVSRMRQQR